MTQTIKMPEWWARQEKQAKTDNWIGERNTQSLVSTQVEKEARNEAGRVAARSAVWNFTCIEPGWVNPLPIFKKNGLFGENTYVREAWSVNTMLATKRNWDLIGESSATGWRKVVNTVLCVAGTYFVNVSGCNFVKGVIGVGYSTVKFAAHTVAFGPLLVLCILSLGLHSDVRKLTAGYFKFMMVDLLSIGACVGHIIPFWVPMLASALLAPHITIPAIALIYGVVKLATQYTGFADMLAYIPTALILAEAGHRSSREDQENAFDSIPEGEKEGLQQQGKLLRRELNPLNSAGGAFVVGGLMVHVVSAALATAVDAFAPGVGSTALTIGHFAVPVTKMIEYGLPFVTFTGSLVGGYCRGRQDNHH
jgi:hypothetical protein